MQLRFWRVEIAVLRLLLLSAKLSVGLSGAGLRNCQLEMETRLMWCNAYYSYIHNPLFSCLLSEDIINWNMNNDTSCLNVYEACPMLRGDYGLIVFENECWVEWLDFRGWKQNRVGEFCIVNRCLVCAAHQKWLEWCKERGWSGWVM